MVALAAVIGIICLVFSRLFYGNIAIYIFVLSNNCFGGGYLSNGVKPIRFCDEGAAIDRANLVAVEKGESNVGKYQISQPQTIEKSISVGNHNAFQSVAEKINKLSSDDVIMYISDDIDKKSSRPVGDINVKIEPILRSSYDKS